RELGPQYPFEQRPGGGVLLAREQQLALPLARLRFAALIARLPVQRRRSGVQPVGLGESVQLHRQVGARERDARPDAGRCPSSAACRSPAAASAPASSRRTASASASGPVWS